MMIKIYRLALVSLVLGWLTGCATPEADTTVNTPATTPTPVPTPVVKPVTTPPPAPLPPVVNEASVLKEGIAAYNNGDYNGAIKRLTSAAEIWGASGSRAGQLDALKYSAFSYCVTGRQIQCRQQFDKALKLDPNFDLAAGEKGHPLWGPAFSKAQKAAKKAPKK